MADFSTLIASIEATIKQNGVQAITGQVLQDELLLMVSAINQLKQDTLEGYAFYGEPLPNGATRVVTQNTFFLAGAGSYTINGSTITITDSGISVIVYDCLGDEITTYRLFAYDANPTNGSANAVTSGGVYNALAGKQDLDNAATEGNLAEFDNAGQVRDAGIATADIATKDGVLPDLFAGYAGNLVDTRSAGTPQGPYAFRQSGGDGVDYMVRIKGRTIVWNQQTPNSIKDKMQAVTTTDQIYISTGSFAGDCYASHKYLFAARVTTLTANDSVWFWGGDRYVNNIGLLSGDWRGWIFSPSSDKTNASFVLVINRGGGGNTGTAGYQDLQLYDLTLMFGAGNEPTTYAQFQSLHSLPYYNNNAGKLINNAATGIKTRGRNAWDEVMEFGVGINNTTGQRDTSIVGANSSPNYIPVLSSTAYYFKCGNASISQFRIFKYAADQSYLGTEVINANDIYTTDTATRFLKFQVGATAYGSVYKNDICINISDASFNGTYEPYWEKEVTLGLNAVACHDENNNAVVVNGLDGVGTAQDTAYGSNGKITHINKVIAEVDLGDLSWTYSGGQFYASMPVDSASPVSGYGIGSICSKYPRVSGTAFASADKAYACNTSDISSLKRIFVKDSAYTDADTFAAAMSGVKLRYELATPKVLTVDTPFPAFVEVDNLGTQERLPADTADNPQGGFVSDSNYSISTANLVRKLSE